MSRPSRARGLKLNELMDLVFQPLSRPSRARGLKLHPCKITILQINGDSLLIESLVYGDLIEDILWGSGLTSAPHDIRVALQTDQPIFSTISYVFVGSRMWNYGYMLDL